MGILLLILKRIRKKNLYIYIFIEKIRANNPEKHIVVILDNFTSHKASDVREKAKK